MSFSPNALVPGAGPRIITSTQVVFDALPDALRAPVIDPVRDLLVDALATLLQEYERRSDLAAAQCDPVRAIERYLAALAGDRSTFQAPGEDEEAFRARALEPTSTVTELAIIAGVNLILSLYTTEQCQFVDAALDGWFVNDGTDGHGNPAIWHSYIGAGPSYPDRYFSDDVLNNGGVPRHNNCDVGEARLFKDALGRHFLLLVPDLGFRQQNSSFVYDGSALGNFYSTYEAGGLFVGDGSDTPTGGYIDASSVDAKAAYRAIGNFVNLAAGQSIRWTMLSN